MKHVVLESVVMGILCVCGANRSCGADLGSATYSGIVVRVYDDAGLGSETMNRITSTGEEGLRRAGVVSRWRNCSPTQSSRPAHACCEHVGPVHLSIRVLPGRMKGNDRALGYSVASSEGGTQSGIFAAAAKAAAAAAGVPVSTLLTLAALHEVGHLLLGADSHYPWGVMTSLLDRKHIEQITAVGPLFTQSQTKSMAAAIAKRVQSSAADARCVRPLEDSRCSGR